MLYRWYRNGWTHHVCLDSRVIVHICCIVFVYLKYCFRNFYSLKWFVSITTTMITEFCWEAASQQVRFFTCDTGQAGAMHSSAAVALMPSLIFLLCTLQQWPPVLFSGLDNCQKLSIPLEAPGPHLIHLTRVTHSTSSMYSKTVSTKALCFPAVCPPHPERILLPQYLMNALNNSDKADVFTSPYLLPD